MEPENKIYWKTEIDVACETISRLMKENDVLKERIAELEKYTIWNPPEDKPLPEDQLIFEAFPTRSGRHDLYVKAQEFVSAKHGKFALIALVNWLLHRIDSYQKK